MTQFPEFPIREIEEEEYAIQSDPERDPRPELILTRREEAIRSDLKKFNLKSVGPRIGNTRSGKRKYNDKKGGRRTPLTQGGTNFQRDEDSGDIEDRISATPSPKLGYNSMPSYLYDLSLPLPLLDRQSGSISNRSLEDSPVPIDSRSSLKFFLHSQVPLVTEVVPLSCEAIDCYQGSIEGLSPKNGISLTSPLEPPMHIENQERPIVGIPTQSIVKISSRRPVVLIERSKQPKFRILQPAEVAEVLEPSEDGETLGQPKVIEMLKQSEARKRYPTRERNPDALCPFSNTKWLDWRTAVPAGTDLSVLREPVEGFDICRQVAPDSGSDDGEFLPDEAVSPVPQPTILVNEYTTSESEEGSPRIAKRRRKSPHEAVPNRKLDDNSSRRFSFLSQTSLMDADEIITPISRKRRATNIVLSDSDDPRPTPRRVQPKSRHARKINFLNYFDSHIVPAFSSRSDIPLFLRICHRRYTMRARDPKARLVDYPWEKSIYFLSLKNKMSKRLIFRLSKPFAARQNTLVKKIPNRTPAKRRARLFTPHKRQNMLAFYHRLDTREQQVYERRQLDPDSFFYCFNEPGFRTNQGQRWFSKEEEWFQDHLSTYQLNKWPLGHHSRINSAKGWGFFSLAIPTRTGRQCEEFYQRLATTNPRMKLPSTPVTRSYHKHVIQAARKVWVDPIVRNYVRDIPLKRRRPRKLVQTKITDYVEPEVVHYSSETDDISFPLPSVEAPESPTGPNHQQWQQVARGLAPQLCGGVYFNTKTYVGSGQLIELMRFAANPSIERLSETLPTLRVAGFSINLEKELDRSSYWIEIWGRQLLKSITCLDYSSPKTDDIMPIFQAYRLLLHNKSDAQLINEQLVIIETFLPAIHQPLQTKLFGPIEEMLSVHIQILDCIARYHLFFPNFDSQLLPCLRRFSDTLVQYAISSAQTCDPLPLNHPVMEGFQVLRVFLATIPNQSSLGIFQEDPNTKLWKVINDSLSNLDNDFEVIWGALDIITRSTAPNNHGIFPAVPPNPSRVPPNWDFFTASLTIKPTHVHELLLRAAGMVHFWHWPLNQELLCSFYDRLKDSCTTSAPQFPEFLRIYSGSLPSLNDVISLPEKYSPFEVFLLLVESYVDQLKVSVSDDRLFLNTVERLQSKLCPTRKLSFDTSSFKENMTTLVNFISARLTVTHSLPLSVKSLDKQMRSFILRLRQLTDSWDAIPTPVLLNIFHGFFIALFMKHKDSPLSPDVLGFIDEISKAAEKDPPLANQFRLLMEELITKLQFEESLKLFLSTSRFFEVVSAYRKPDHVLVASIAILDKFLVKVVNLIFPPPVHTPLSLDFDIEDFEDFDDEELELLTQRRPDKPPILHSMAKSLFAKNVLLRLTAILSTHMDSMLDPFIVLRCIMSIHRIFISCQLPTHEEFWKATSFGDSLDSTYSPAHHVRRTLLQDRAWLMLLLLDSKTWDKASFDMVILIWAHTISDPLTRRHELLIQCLNASKSFRFRGDSWRRLPLLSDTKLAFASEPETLDAPSLVLPRLGLISDVIETLESQSEASLCHNVLVSLLDGVRYNLQRDPHSGILAYACKMVDQTFKALPWLFQHEFLGKLPEAVLPLSAGGLLWPLASYDSLLLRVRQFQYLDYESDSNLQKLLWGWYRNLVIRDLETPNPQADCIDKVARLFLPAVSAQQAWNGPPSRLRMFLHGAVISPILLQSYTHWRRPTLDFLKSVLASISGELSGCLVHSNLFKLLCSPVQVELDLLLHSLHYLALADPQDLLLDFGLESYLGILSALAQISTIIQRENPEFFDLNLIWFQKIELILSSILTNLHRFWLHLIREIGPSLRPNQQYLPGERLELTWENYSQNALHLLTESRHQFLASGPPSLPSIVPVQVCRPASPPPPIHDSDQLVRVSAAILKSILPTWHLAAQLSPTLKETIWTFFALSSPTDPPYFFTILDPVLKLPTTCISTLQLKDLFQVLGLNREALLLGWLKTCHTRSDL